MKKTQLFTFIFLVFTFFSKQIKAQDDDPFCGWYVDGVKTDKIDCYSFGKLQLVLPSNSAWSSFDKLVIHISFVSGGTLMYQVPPIDAKLKLQNGAFKAYVKGKYIVYTVIAKGEQLAKSFQNEAGGTHPFLTRNMMGHDEIMMGKGGKPAKDVPLKVSMYAQTITGYQESYDAGCNCITKMEVTEDTRLSPTYILNCTKRETSGKDVKEPIDLTPPCTVVGTKVDLDNLGGASSNDGSGNVTINNTVIVKNEVTTSTNNTSISSNAIVPSALKPLDKNKPGYFAEKDGAQISREGYKKGDALNGEVRVYTEGKIREISIYVNDQKNGPSTLYYENGKVDMTGNYKNDEKDGEWKMYNDAGKLKETKKYLNGEVQD